MISARTTLLLLAALAASAVALARAPTPFKTPSRGSDGWPGWRGPQRSGISRETGLLAKWPREGPRLIWRTSGIGTGFSTPAIVKGRIYLLGMRGGKEHVLALDAAHNGKELWSAELGPSAKDGPPSYPGPRSTATVDGERIYALGSSGELLCLGLDGKEIWRKHLVRDLNGVLPRWGYAESPLIDRDLLVCTPGGTATLAALNTKTGAVVWKTSVARGNGAAYASPIVAEVGRVRHYVQFLGGCLVGVAAADGKLLWSYDGVVGSANCTTPIFHDGHIFVSTLGRVGKAGGALLELTAKGPGVTAREVYQTRDLGNHYGGVVCLGGCLYGTNASALVCLDFKSGQTKWQNPAVGKGSIAAADGHLYLRGDRGSIALVAASPAGYQEKSRFDPPNPGRVMPRPHPVIAGGRLYLRDQDVLLCFDLKKP
jgi:outer membrane protein assembly factor BamB